MTSIIALAALKVLILAGGGEAAENHNSHLTHVLRLSALLEARGVPAEDVSVFWADGMDPGPDRAVVRGAPSPEDWRVVGTALDAPTAVVPELLDTRFERVVFPAQRAALQAWLAEVGARSGPNDTLLIAVTDHGEPGEDGTDDSSITLWGESWKASEMVEDLAPVQGRVVLWLSQCFSGGFARVVEARPNTCGAFAATADRPSYGCYPGLAERDDVGHFHRMLEAFEGAASIDAASERVMLTDQSPDTPHLSSDAFVFRRLDEQALRHEVDLHRLIDNRLGQRPGGHPVLRQAGRIAARFGLGAPSSYFETVAILDALDQSRYALEVWTDEWQRTLSHAIDVETEDLVREIGEPRGREARARARARARKRIGRILRDKPAIAARVERLRAKVAAAQALGARLDVQEAAAVRAAYTLARAGVGALTAAEQARYAALRDCEQAPILPLPSGAAPASDADQPAPVTETVPPVWSLHGEVEALAPGYLGVGYRDRPRHKGVVVERFQPVAPAGASALRVGDEIHAVDGWKLSRRGGFREAMKLATPGGLAQLGVKRGKETLTIPTVVAPMPLPPPTPLAGDAVPPFRMRALDPTVPLPTVGEGQPLVIIFWATWCKPCKEAVPALQRWAAERGVRALALTQEPRATVKRFARKHRGFALPIALDPDGAASRLFRVDRTPTFVHLDARGRLVQRADGYKDQIPLRGEASD